MTSYPNAINIARTHCSRPDAELGNIATALAEERVPSISRSPAGAGGPLAAKESNVAAT